MDSDNMPKTYHKKTNRQHTSRKPQTLPAKFQAGFLAALDGRTDLAKTLRSNYNEVLADIGGEEEVGHVKSALIERFVWLEAVMQTIEHEMANGELSKTDVISRWIQAVNALSGLAKTLGVERKPRSASWATVIPSADDSSANLEDK